MNIKTICDTIFKVYLYALSTKMYHYSTPSNHGHQLADEIYDKVRDFADELAEQTFGFYGKPRFTDMSVNQDIIEEDDLNKLCQHITDTIEPLRQEFLKNEKLSGLVSLIDDFKGELGKLAFLGTFDKLSGYTLQK